MLSCIEAVTISFFLVTQTLLLPQAAERLLHPDQPKTELLGAKHNRYISQHDRTVVVCGSILSSS